MKYNLSLADAKRLYDIMNETKSIPSAFTYAIEINIPNIPKCPTCNSTNIEKISFTKKAIGGVMFGLLSSNIRNTMHCKNCGAKW